MIDVLKTHLFLIMDIGIPVRLCFMNKFTVPALQIRLI